MIKPSRIAAAGVASLLIFFQISSFHESAFSLTGFFDDVLSEAEEDRLNNNNNDKSHNNDLQAGDFDIQNQQDEEDDSSNKVESGSSISFSSESFTCDTSTAKTCCASRLLQQGGIGKLH